MAYIGPCDGTRWPSQRQLAGRVAQQGGPLHFQCSFLSSLVGAVRDDAERIVGTIAQRRRPAMAAAARLAA
jgi:hypothetical protein